MSTKEHERVALLDESFEDHNDEIDRLQRLIHRFKIVTGILLAALITSTITIAIVLHRPLSTSPLKQTPITFHENTSFSGSSSATTDAAWGSITPPGDGFITLTSQNITRDVSMYHQLHCLRHIRTYLWTMKFAVDYGTVEQTMKAMDPKLDHVGHCFDYLRQGILCAGDLALEVPREGDGGVDGWGTVHQCVDPGVVQQFMEAHRLERYS